MSRTFRRHPTGVLAALTVLALVDGGVAAILATSGGSSPTSVLAASGQRTPATPATDAHGTPSRHAPAMPSPTRPTGPAPGSSPATKAPGPGTRTHPRVAEKPPPVVDGVRRGNVGSAHSPQVLHQMSGSPATTPPPADAGAVGVDVADYQHPRGAAIDWSRVAAAGYKFAFIKATEGDYYGNPYYAADLAQAKAAGLYATGYHFAVPNVSGGASQAEYAVRNGGYAADGRSLPLALDIEYNPYGAECYGLSAALMVSWLSAFTAEVRRLTGQWPIIYTTADWWRTCTGGSTAFGSDPLWVAAYRSGSPPVPAGWANWTFWQYTSRGSVPGITGDVDVSYFLRAAVSLLEPGRPSPSPSRSPSPSPPSPSSAPPSSSPPPSPSSAPAPSSLPPPSSPSAPPTSPPPPSPSSPPSPSPSPATEPPPATTESPPTAAPPSASMTGP